MYTRLFQEERVSPYTKLPHTSTTRHCYLYSAVWGCGVRSDIYAIWKVVLAQAQSASSVWALRTPGYVRVNSVLEILNDV
jgi:hypothetical protein